MKNIHYLIHGILLLAVIILFVLHFSNSSKTPANRENIYQMQSGQPVEIAYVNLDSLLIHYEYSRELNEQFTGKQTKYKNELKRKADTFEKEAAEFQEKVQRGAFLSQQRAESEQERLLLEQQKLQQLEYEISNNLVAEQQELNMRLYDSISNFLKEFQKINPYRLVISYTYGGPILYADKKMDITNDILTALNKRYKK